MNSLFSGKYKGKKVIVTGDTGFKGSWLTLWLKTMGAVVYGISLKPESESSHINLLKINYESICLDIREKDELSSLIADIAPDLIFHLAAQPLVRLSYEDPYNTFATNIMGTINVLDAARTVGNLKGVIIVTSDKCYDNKEWFWGYRENEPMGGKDPYSASKGCAELVTAAYRSSYFPILEFGKSHHTLISSVRAGNVIGGGDWAKDRIVPDMIKAAVEDRPLLIRYPNATRPWQHVLEPLSGYLCIGQKLLESEVKFADSWNFGPNLDSNVKVIDLVLLARTYWKAVRYDIDTNIHRGEANFLMLDSSKAINMLGWHSVWDFEQTVMHTIEWYKEYFVAGRLVSEIQLMKYVDEARKKMIKWAIS